LVNRAERGLLPAIETLTKLDLGDSARTEVSNVSGIASGAITGAILSRSITNGTVGVICGRVDNGTVGVISRRVDNTTSVGTEGEGVGLGSKRDGSPRSGIEEQVGAVGRVLSLNEIVKPTVLRSLLAEDRISEARWIRGEVWRGVLLSLAVLDGGSDHLGLSGGIELTRSVCKLM
jgi:hypothetical protein